VIEVGPAVIIARNGVPVKATLALPSATQSMVRAAIPTIRQANKMLPRPEQVVATYRRGERTMNSNKGTLIVIAVLALGLLAGCASRRQMRQMATHMSVLETQNAALIQALDEQKAEAEVKKTKAVAKATPVAAPAPVPFMPAGAPMMSVPPSMTSRMDNPPKNVGSLYQEMLACNKTPLHYRIHNDTNLHYKLMLDGKPIIVNGERRLPYLPPGETVHLCVDRLGKHRLTGVGYAMRGRTPVRVKKFSKITKMGSADGSGKIADFGYHDWIR
jgi:outer membrane murein-binding lipoprotein Lpp